MMVSVSSKLSVLRMRADDHLYSHHALASDNIMGHRASEYPARRMLDSPCIVIGCILVKPSCVLQSPRGASVGIVPPGQVSRLAEFGLQYLSALCCRSGHGEADRSQAMGMFRLLGERVGSLEWEAP
jgi:hypothetical protein